MKIINMSNSNSSNNNSRASNNNNNNNNIITNINNSKTTQTKTTTNGETISIVLIKTTFEEVLSARDGDFRYTNKTWTRMNIDTTNTKDIQISNKSNSRASNKMHSLETMDLRWNFNLTLTITTTVRVTKILEEISLNLTGVEWTKVKLLRTMIIPLKIKTKTSEEAGWISKLILRARVLIKIAIMDLVMMVEWILTLID